MTKLSHLHFVATDDYARRVIQLGEEPWRVTLAGAPSLDNLAQVTFLDRKGLRETAGLRLKAGPLLLVTYHPVTLEYEQTGWQVRELLAALDLAGLPCVFTMPNADTHGRVIRKLIQAYTQTHPEAQAVENLGTQGYFSLMKLASAMVGNSSSGMVEAASFGLPVVNIGTRQTGRTAGPNVLHVDYSRQAILAGIRKALDQGFRASLDEIVNPYGAGDAAGKIVAVLKSVEIDQKLLVKHFHDLEGKP
jgi:UDP-hydrolysing UDP-N-acetyl-D-glucosamine 2-epimerase